MMIAQKMKILKTKNIIILFSILISLPTFSQIKDNNLFNENVKDGIIKQQSGELFGFFNSNKFHMDHIYNLSFSTFGSNQFSVGSYTNRIFYNFNNKLNFQLWTSIVTTPYSTLNNSPKNKFNGIYIDKASINFKPTKNFMIDFQFSNNPYRYYNTFYNYNLFPGFNYGYDFNPFIY